MFRTAVALVHCFAWAAVHLPHVLSAQSSITFAAALGLYLLLYIQSGCITVIRVQMGFKLLKVNLLPKSTRSLLMPFISQKSLYCVSRCFFNTYWVLGSSNNCTPPVSIPLFMDASSPCTGGITVGGTQLKVKLKTSTEWHFWLVKVILRIAHCSMSSLLIPSLSVYFVKIKVRMIIKIVTFIITTVKSA